MIIRSSRPLLRSRRVFTVVAGKQTHSRWGSHDISGNTSASISHNLRKVRRIHGCRVYAANDRQSRAATKLSSFGHRRFCRATTFIHNIVLEQERREAVGDEKQDDDSLDESREFGELHPAPGKTFDFWEGFSSRKRAWPDRGSSMDANVSALARRAAKDSSRKLRCHPQLARTRHTLAPS